MIYVNTTNKKEKNDDVPLSRKTTLSQIWKQLNQKYIENPNYNTKAKPEEMYDSQNSR